MSAIAAEQRQTLIAAALDARKLSYSPYSKFRVGAAILCVDDKGQHVIVPGANVENASYGGTICAERTGFVRAVTEGYKAGSFLAVAVASGGYASCALPSLDRAPSLITRC